MCQSSAIRSRSPERSGVPCAAKSVSGTSVALSRELCTVALSSACVGEAGIMATAANSAPIRIILAPSPLAATS